MLYKQVFHFFQFYDLIYSLVFRILSIHLFLLFQILFYILNFLLLTVQLFSSNYNFLTFFLLLFLYLNKFKYLPEIPNYLQLYFFTYIILNTQTRLRRPDFFQKLHRPAGDNPIRRS
jgi:hypothetical protein